MQTARETEIDRNYDFFQRNLGRFLKSRRGQFALLKNAEVIDWYSGPGEAYRAGLAKFGAEVFSIQEADDRPAEIGLSSFALD